MKNWINKCHFGDCRESMRAMILDGVKVQTIVTSPPYYGLRDYGHDGQLGLEETPDQYIAAMVDVFDAARDLLSNDGTLWLNIGDSYAGSWGNQGRKETRGTQRPINGGMMQPVDDGRYPSKGSNTGKIPEGSGLKPKDLIGIPWMLAFALRADGWYLRSDIIWSKGNPMPESVTDRPTKSHEYIFLLSKSQHYFYDHEAIKEEATRGAAGSKFNSGKTAEHQQGRSSEAERVEDGNRNRRTVWNINTQPYSGAHFAVFPEALVEPCVLAGSRVGDVVFDPFFGSGTTGQVASHLGRRFLGCELNPAYEALQRERLRQPGLMLEVA